MKRFVTEKIGNKIYTYELSVTESIKWTFYEWIVLFGVLMLFYSLLMLVVPFLLIFLFFSCIKSERQIINILGCACSILVCLDFHFGWMMHVVYNDFLNAPAFFKLLMNINLGLGLAHFALFFIGDRVMDDGNRNQKFVPSAIAVFAVFVFVGSLLGNINKPYLQSKSYLIEQEQVKAKEDAEEKELDDRLKKFESHEEGF